LPPSCSWQAPSSKTNLWGFAGKGGGGVSQRVHSYHKTNPYLPRPFLPLEKQSWGTSGSWLSRRPRQAHVGAALGGFQEPQLLSFTRTENRGEKSNFFSIQRPVVATREEVELIPVEYFGVTWLSFLLVSAMQVLSNPCRLPNPAARSTSPPPSSASPNVPAHPAPLQLNATPVVSLQLPKCRRRRGPWQKITGGEWWHA